MDLAAFVEAVAKVLLAVALALAFGLLLVGGALLYFDRLMGAVGYDPAPAALPHAPAPVVGAPALPVGAAGLAGARDPVIGTDIARAEVHARIAALQRRQAQAHAEAHERSLMTRGF